MAAKKKARKAKAKSVKGGLLPAVHAAFDKYRGATPHEPDQHQPRRPGHGRRLGLASRLSPVRPAHL